jgi:hypothetical protein
MGLLSALNHRVRCDTVLLYVNLLGSTQFEARVLVDVELVPLPYARCMKEVDRGLLAGCFDTLHDPILEYGTAGTLSRSFGRVLVSMGGWAMCWCLTA